MTYIVSIERRREIMRSVKGENTTPEITVRRYLFSKEIRYRLHQKKLPESPDIVLPKYNTIIFINGCFWHRHKNCRRSSIPLTNKNFWEKNFRRIL